MINENTEFLKQRSREFWDNALLLVSQNKYNLAVFSLEQSCQLFLKYLISKQIGDWPKTHYLSELIKKMSEVYENEKIRKFYEENEIYFDDLTDAYFTSRYIPKNFTKNVTEKLVEMVKTFMFF